MIPGKRTRARPAWLLSRCLRLTLLLSIIVAPAGLQAQPFDWDRLWSHFESATKDRSLIAPALAHVREARPPEGHALSAEDTALLDAFEGALLAMSATTTAWPPSKLSRVRAGLSLLDGAVAAAPAHPEVRYLRLVICHHLPSLFGRRGTARADAASLAGMLLAAPPDPSTDRHRRVAAFLLETGYLADSLHTAIQSRFPPQS